MTTNRIGWEVVEYAASIKAGSSGQQRATMIVTDEDGQPLPDYSGWSASVIFRNPFTGTPAITFTPPVTGNAIAMTLAIDLDFVPADTVNLAPGVYLGDICMTSPIGEKYKPTKKYELTVEWSGAS